MSNAKFNKKEFARLLKKAMGNRNMNQFALHTGVSLTYISELARELRDKPPMPPTIKKFANKAYGVSYEELMKAAGHLNKLDGSNPASHCTLDDEWPDVANILRRKGKKATPADKRRIAKIIEAAIEDTEE